MSNTTTHPFHCRIGKWTPKKYSRSRYAPVFAVTTAKLRKSLARRAGE